MTQTQTQNQNAMPELDGSGDVDPNGRVPDFDIGIHDVVIQSCRYRATPGFNLLGLVGDKVRGCFVSLKKNPLYAINYGTRDLKRLIAASKGFAQDSDAAKAITEQEIREFLGPTQPGAGRRIRVEARQGKPNPKKPGQFYTEVQFYPSPDRSLGPVVAAAMTVDDLLGWAQSRRDEGAGPYTINCDLSKLGTVIRYASSGLPDVIGAITDDDLYIKPVGGAAQMLNMQPVIGRCLFGQCGMCTRNAFQFFSNGSQYFRERRVVVA